MQQTATAEPYFGDCTQSTPLARCISEIQIFIHEFYVMIDLSALLLRVLEFLEFLVSNELRNSASHGICGSMACSSYNNLSKVLTLR